MHPVDSSTAVPPSVYRTWFIVLVVSAYHSLLDKTKGKSAEVQSDEKEFEADDGYDSSTTGSEQPGSGTVTPREGTNGNRKPTMKAGGKRRKALRKR